MSWAHGDFHGMPVALTTPRLALEPLELSHATEMVEALKDPGLYRHIGGTAPTPAELAARYRELVRGRSADGSQLWFNWILRLRASRQVVGYVQATVETASQAGASVGWLAWLIASEHQGRGLATEAAGRVGRALHSGEGDLPVVRELRASILPGHSASERVAGKLGMRPAPELTAPSGDGERVWGAPPSNGRWDRWEGGEPGSGYARRPGR